MTRSTISTSQLKGLLARIGSAVDGTKPVLRARLARDLQTPRLPPSKINSNRASSPKTSRILSIDMGIKNLAFCVCDVALNPTTPPNPRAQTEASAKTKANDPPTGPAAHITAIAWRRIDVAHETAHGSSDPVPKDPDGYITPTDPFHPRNLASIAHALLTRILLPYAPDIILIERQRWRSFGGAAILEWTVRVNMLEGMLWAVLNSLREEERAKKADKGFPSVFDVSPARVGAFWVDAPRVTTVATQAVVGEEGVVGAEEGRVSRRGKVKKVDKVALVREWVAARPFDSSRSKIAGRVPIAFEFGEEAEKTRRFLCERLVARKKRGSEVKVVGDKRKFDDLADCFLQAAAWVAWEGARLKILQDGGDKLSEELLDEETTTIVKTTKQRSAKLKTETSTLETKGKPETRSASRKKEAGIARSATKAETGSPSKEAAIKGTVTKAKTRSTRNSNT